MNEIQFQDNHLAARIHSADDQLWLTLTNRVHNRQWPALPLLELDVYDKTVRRTETFRRYHVNVCESVADGARVVVSDTARGIVVGLGLSVHAGELVVTLRPTEVEEHNAALYRVFAINVLPGLMQVPAAGVLLLPLNSGILCHPRNKPVVRDRFLIYGEQERWELLPMLPVCAAHGPDGGWLALATAVAAEAECRVATDGAGVGEVGFAFSLRRYWPDPVDPELREFRYVPIAPSADPVKVVARRLRRHVLDDLGKPTLTQRLKESPELADACASYTMKLFHGMQNDGLLVRGRRDPNPPDFFQCLTFAEATTNLQRLHDAGIAKVYVQSVGWNARGHDGLYPTRFPIEERLGGEADFREMVAAGQRLGYRMGVHDNFIMATLASPDFNREHVVQDIYGEPLIHGIWGGGIECAQWLTALPEELVTGYLQRVKALGVQGPYYMDYMGQPLEVNYHPRHGGSRAACQRGMERVLRAGQQVFGAVGTELGFLHAAVASDYMVTYGNQWQLKACRPEWPITALLEKRIPLWKLALSGLIITEAGAPPTWQTAMRTILMGDHPRDEWSAHPGLMPVLDDARIHAQKALSDLCLGRFGHLQFLEMVDHQEPGPGIEQTQFADGTTIRADFNDHHLFVNDQPLAAPPGLL